MRLKGLFLLVILLMLTACVETGTDQSTQTAHQSAEKRGSVLIAKQAIELSHQQEVDKNVSGVESETGLYIVDNPDSIQVYVNKNRRLPEDFAPDDLIEPDVSHLATEGDDRRLLRKEVAHALEDLFSAALDEDQALVAVSGYHTHQRQITIYQSSIARNGQAYADRYLVQPGTSEHEAGLAMDVSAASVAFALEQSFSQTEEGIWLAENAYQFGFIIRYPEGKEGITGYAYEPWHLRYVGEDLAEELYNKSLTLEEYFDYHYELDYMTEE